MNPPVRLLAALVVVTSSAAAQLTVPPAPPPREIEPYEHGVIFPKPTSAQLDSLLKNGIVPRVLDQRSLRPMYWPRAAFVVAGRAQHRSFMTQALDGGFGLEGDIGIPLGHTDNGLFLFARANAYRVVKPGWLGWSVDAGQAGVVFNGGGGASIAIPLRHPQFSFPLSISAGMALFQSGGDRPAETYVSFDPAIGLRYRIFPSVAALARLQGAWMVALKGTNRNMGSWSAGIGIELSLALQRESPLQYWVPPLVVTAQDVVQLLSTEVTPPVNVFDRNLDFINTELKPITAFGWYDLGFSGEVRGTIVASSRASSGNVTALDVKIDSADRRGFRVTRLLSPINPAMATIHQESSTPPPPGADIIRDTVALGRVRRGDYAFRPPDELGVRYLRVEVFPQAKGPLELIPKLGSKVVIQGDVRWDGDGHVELHPRRVGNVVVVTGEFLDSDDPVDEE